MMPRISFNKKIDKIVETILYLSHKVHNLDAYKVVKLIYLADIAHLNKHGRPVTFDRIVAMKAGPVASTAYDILKGNYVKGVKTNELPFSVTEIDQYVYVENPHRQIKRTLFSKSDLRILDETIDIYGNADPKELYEETHKHFAYRRAWENRGKSKAPVMLFEDMIRESSIKGDIVSDLEAIALHL